MGNVNIQQERKRPILLTIFSLLILVSTIWWFGKLILHPEIINNSNNIIYSVTKFGAFISSIGMLLLRKWGVYLYAATYVVTCILFFILDQPLKLPENQQTMIGGIVIAIVTILLFIMFKKNWNKLK
jgi:hypothetical protein